MKKGWWVKSVDKNAPAGLANPAERFGFVNPNRASTDLAHHRKVLSMVEKTSQSLPPYRT
jgi:hypothetical protein